MKSIRKFVALFTVLLLLGGLFPAAGGAFRPVPAQAAGPVYTHDGGELLALLQKDGPAEIILDGDVRWTEDHIYHHGTTGLTVPGEHGQIGQQVWAILGSGDKSLDLAGHDLHISVDDTYSTTPNQPVQIFMAEIPTGASLTVNDSSGTNAGEIMFDGYIHAGASGALGTQHSNYQNGDVIYRNVFYVTGGSLTFNGGEIATRKKLQYIDPCRPWNSVIGSRYVGDVSQQVNCVGIWMEDGQVTVNGGIISGRGYRYMYAGSWDEMYYASSEFYRAAAIWARGGNLLINNGTFNGMGCADVLDVYAADSVTVRSGFFHTHKVDKLLVPSAVDAGTDSGTGAARYMTGSYGHIGLHSSFLNDEVSDVIVKGEKINFYKWDEYIMDNTNDVTIRPDEHALLYLLDPRTSALVENNITWDGKTDLVLTVSLPDRFPEYPWKDNYYHALVQSTLTSEATAKVTIGGQVHSAGGEIADVQKDQEWDHDTLAAAGQLSFNVKDFLPDDLKGKNSFVIRAALTESLMPYNKNATAACLTHTRIINVTIDNSAVGIVKQPENIWGDGSDTLYFLEAQAANATNAYWVMEWPEFKTYTYEGDMKTLFTVDPETGIATAKLALGSTNDAHYFHCVFFNDYSSANTDTVSVRNSFEVADGHGQSDPIPLSFYTGTDDNPCTNYITVEGDVFSAFMRTRPTDRTVRWYKGTGSEQTLIAQQAGTGTADTSTGLYIPTSTLHLCMVGQKTDDGLYHAEVDLVINGEKRTFSTPYYNVTAIYGAVPNTISEIRIAGLSDLYFGGPIPTKDDLWTESGLYSIDSLVWNGGTSATTFGTPHPYYTMVIKPRDGYSFTYTDGKLPVYVDGVIRGYAETGPFDYAHEARFGYTFDPHYNQDLKPQAGLAANQSDFAQGHGKELSSLAVNIYSPYGQIEDAGTINSAAYRNASDAISWLTLGAEDGSLTAAVLAEEPVGYRELSRLDIKTAATGSVTLPAGYHFVVTKAFKADITLPEDTTTLDHEHTWTACTDNGDGTHTHTCAGCGAELTGDHVWDDGEVTKDATPTAEGVMTFTCEECGATKTKPIPFETHSHLTLVPAVAATCETDGSIAYYVCEECQLMFADENALEEIPDEAALIVPATGHDWGAWTTVTEAATGKPGEQQRVCATDKTHTETRALYLLSFNLDGGTLDGVTGTYTMQAANGETITIPKAPTREGYTFDYWQGSTYHPGDAYTVEGEHAFTAVWKPNREAEAPRTGTDSYQPLFLLLMVLSLGGVLMILRHSRSAK